METVKFSIFHGSHFTRNWRRRRFACKSRFFICVEIGVCPSRRIAWCVSLVRWRWNILWRRLKRLRSQDLRFLWNWNLYTTTGIVRVLPRWLPRLLILEQRCSGPWCEGEFGTVQENLIDLFRWFVSWWHIEPPLLSKKKRNIKSKDAIVRSAN